MRIIHGEDYTEQDRLDFRSIIFHNVLKGAKILVEARRRLQIPLENPENEANGFAVSNYHRSESLTPEEFHQYVAPLKALWADSGIQSTFKRSNEFQLVCFLPSHPPSLHPSFPSFPLTACCSKRKHSEQTAV
jgi:hypothetical protein